MRLAQSRGTPTTDANQWQRPQMFWLTDTATARLEVMHETSSLASHGRDRVGLIYVPRRMFKVQLGGGCIELFVRAVCVRVCVFKRGLVTTNLHLASHRRRCVFFAEHTIQQSIL